MTHTSPVPQKDDGSRPARAPRRDAERNRLRILQAAAEVFSERGLDATLDDVARQAGVGVGTVYRRYPNKEALAEALLAERLDALADIAGQFAAEPDSWTGLVSFFEQVGVMFAGDRGLRQVLMFANSRDGLAYRQHPVSPAVRRLIERAQADGHLRTDLSPTDWPCIEFMISAAAEYTQHVRPELWRRYLALMLDGLRAHRTTATALPEPALSAEETAEAARPSAIP